ncbi:ATP-binding cassette sub-family G member 1 [Halotydeus destructor]|nr:ATP-binding cassette sub-family G member 1 [Halotydeus destructor]
MDVEDSALIIDVNGNPNHGQRPRVELTWTNVNCFVEEVHWSLQWKPMKKTKKTILSDVTGVVQSGSVTAIIGPSGAGKSTLLTILSGRKTHGVEGNVMVAVDGKKKTPKVGIAFMEQRDIFSGSLTVRETLMFASKLKNFNEGPSLCLSQHVMVALAMGFLYSENAGQSNGCYGQYGQPGGMSFDALKAFRTEESKTNQNIGFLFINTMFIFLSSLMSTVLTFPLEIGVFEKETANKWYSCGSYYTARSLADAPFRLLYPILHSIIVYQMTGQIEDNQRFVLFVFINILVAFLGQSKGMMFGAIYANKVEVACFVAPVSSILPFLFSGFFVNLSTMPMWLKPLEILSYYKYGFDSLLTLFYGFHRCDNILESIRELNTSNPFYDFYNSLQKVNISLSEVTPSLEFYLSSVKHVSDALIDEVVDNMKRVDKATITMFDANSTLIATDSYVMSHFNLDDSAFYSSIVTLFIFIIVFRLVAYIVLLLKSKQFK